MCVRRARVRLYRECRQCVWSVCVSLRVCRVRCAVCVCSVCRVRVCQYAVSVCERLCVVCVVCVFGVGVCAVCRVCVRALCVTVRLCLGCVRLCVVCVVCVVGVCRVCVRAHMSVVGLDFDRLHLRYRKEATRTCGEHRHKSRHLRAGVLLTGEDRG